MLNQSSPWYHDLLKEEEKVWQIGGSKFEGFILHGRISGEWKTSKICTAKLFSFELLLNVQTREDSLFYILNWPAGPGKIIILMSPKFTLFTLTF